MLQLLDLFKGSLESGACFPLFGDVHGSADHFDDFAALVYHGVSDRVKMSYPSIWKNNSIIAPRVHISLLRGLQFRPLFDARAIFRMNSFENMLPSRSYLLGVVTKNAKVFQRPKKSAGLNIPSPASATGQPLRLGQITFAPAKRLFGKFAFGN